MAEFQTIKLADIIVPDRLRIIEEDHALAISASIVEHGLINPITVRRTPPATKPFKPFTLIAGAHRMRAVELADDDQIEAMIVDADKDEAQLVEITENLFRNELSALDRAMFVMSYREVWERKYGKIEAHRRNGANLAQLIADEAEAGFAIHVADRLGLSKRAVYRAQNLAQKLSPDLRRTLRGTPDADNQSLLLKLAKLPADRQKLVSLAYQSERDMAKALDLTNPDAKAQVTKSAQDRLFETLLSTWGRADAKTRQRFLEYVAANASKPRERMPKLSELVAEIDAKTPPGGGRASGPQANHHLRNDRE